MTATFETSAPAPSTPPTTVCDECPGRLVCRCLQVTEEQLVTALTRLNLRTLGEVKNCTGAGDGCMGCHRTIKGYIARFSTTPSNCVIASPK